jgi:hypothetical protein
MQPCQNGPKQTLVSAWLETNNLNISKTTPSPQITLHIMSHQPQAADLPNISCVTAVTAPLSAVTAVSQASL